MFSSARVVVAGLRGGSGKTIVTLGLIRAFVERGLKVAPFKKGPDYIDAGWMAFVSSQPCYNLDLFLFSHDEILRSFITHSQSSDIAVIEGNRGLFDGRDRKGTNSTAELSLLLKSPVIVVLDCTKSTRTMAALVKGCQVFDPQISLKGVILNNIGGKRHESIVTDTIEKYCDIPVLGVVPRMGADILPMRHLGLTPHQEFEEINEARNAFSQVAQYLDFEAIRECAQSASPLHRIPSVRKMSDIYIQTRIGVLKDSAFQFYYPDNIEKLKEKGAHIIEISSLTDTELPQIDALYIGGGFPETHAIALAQNSFFRNSLKKAIEDGLPVYAECGGLMYLAQYLNIKGKRYPMCGVLPLSFILNSKPQAHGYTIVEVRKENPFFSVGLTLKGHEFHYSHVVEYEKEKNTYFAFTMKRGEGIYHKLDGLCYKNVFATYTHLHAVGSPQWVEGMIKAAQRRIVKTQ